MNRIGWTGLRTLPWLLLVALLAGCVSIPDSGPLEPGGGASQAPSGEVEIEPEPPVADGSPATIVEGFLHAMANYRTDYSVAREYLADSVREQWRPETGVQVYGDGYPIVSGDDVVLTAPLVGTLDGAGSYTHGDGELRFDFEMVLDANGQWRIGHPPDGLLISQYLFERFYDKVNLYFFDPTWTSLVPDPVYIPRGNQSATTLVKGLLSGPTRWLRPAVVSAIPEKTELGLSIPVDGAGVAEVSLSGPVGSLDAAQSSQVVAQLVWTLRQLGTVTGLRISVNGKPWGVADQNPDGTVPIGVQSMVAPIPVTQSSQLMVLTADGVGRAVTTGGVTSVQAIAGPFGERGGQLSAIASSPTSSDRIAALSSDAKSLSVADAVADTEPTVLLRNRTSLLTPQFSRFDELWTADRGSGGTTFLRVVEGRVQDVEATPFEDRRVTRFRISPDGTRMAAVVEQDGRQQLGLALIVRGERTRIVNWRPLLLTGTDIAELTRIAGVGWSSDTELMLLAGSSGSSLLPYLVDQDAAEIEQLGQEDWRPVALASSPQVGERVAVVLGHDGQLYSLEGEYRWQPLLGRVRAVAYPG